MNAVKCSIILLIVCMNGILFSRQLVHIDKIGVVLYSINFCLSTEVDLVTGTPHVVASSVHKIDKLFTARMGAPLRRLIPGGYDVRSVICNSCKSRRRDIDPEL